MVEVWVEALCKAAQGEGLAHAWPCGKKPYASCVLEVITKSISRFARNTQDCLQYSRKLKNLGIGIFFEKENINTLDAAGGAALYHHEFTGAGGEPLHLGELRAGQMMELTAQPPLETVCPEIVNMVLECVEVHDGGLLHFYFLDGTELEIEAEE